MAKPITIALPLAASALLLACGGGSNAVDEVLSLIRSDPTLTVRLTREGTRIDCGNTGAYQATLVRETPVVADNGAVSTTTSQQAISCDTPLLLENDRTLSSWTLQLTDSSGTEAGKTTTTTRLPAPLMLLDGSDWVPMPVERAELLDLKGLALVASDANGNVLTSVAAAQTARVAGSAVAGWPASGGTWSWRVTRGTTTFSSVEQTPFSLTRSDLGLWGSMTVADVFNDGTAVMLGTRWLNGLLSLVGYPAIGLEALSQNRAFRDVRVVDLDNDGINDLVANVYGNGCTLVGIGKSTGGYDYRTPLRQDGTCIGGNGETILVADFNDDGLPDIVLPSYQRMDFLRNLGAGQFIEEADSIGLSMPDYRPTVEGATAVDIDLNGTVDIAIAGELFLNDGSGHFTKAVLPFGGVVMQDEGLGVADLDGDGYFDIVKFSPAYGPRYFWGGANRTRFTDGGYIYGGAQVSTWDSGLAVGYLSGADLPEVLLTGGGVAGTGPQLCVADRSRQVQCLKSVVPGVSGQTQDLLLVSDVDGDGAPELFSRFTTIQMDKVSAPTRQRFQIDLRDANGRRNLQGHAFRAVCTVGGQTLQLRFIDAGGNGYMAQTHYPVSFTSTHCDTIWLDVATRSGLKRLGPYGTGLQRIDLTPALLATATDVS